jgi:hypothetical protein
MHSHLSIGRALDGIVREGRSEQIPADALEAFAIATLHGDGGVKLHAEGGDEYRCGIRFVAEHVSQRWPG